LSRSVSRTGAGGGEDPEGATGGVLVGANLSDRSRLHPLEIATGVVLGATAPRVDSSSVATDRLPEALHGGRQRSFDASPLGALERAMVPLLRARPCLVSFSGGRDSSLALAVAVRVARSTGQAPPVPITLRFPGDTEASEIDWQERVIAELGVEDWVRLELSTELDLLGELALSVRRRHGLQFPPNAHFHVPMLEYARGGTLITGNGGDELLGEWRGRAAADLLARRAKPTRQGLRALARAAAPPVARRLWSGRRTLPRAQLPWLSEAGIRLYTDALGREFAVEPSLWRARIAWRSRRRWRSLTNASLQRIANDHGVQMAHPLLDRDFVRALGAAGGRLGYGTRTQAMRALFGSVLSEWLIARPTKARFNDVFWGPASRALAREWDGRLQGELAALTLPDAVRDGWLRKTPDARMALLLQAAHHAGDVAA
jgi:hypothetical protein